MTISPTSACTTLTPASYVGPWLWKVWEALRLKNPRRGHEVSSAARAPGTECADFPAFQSVRSRLPERLPHCLSDAAPGQRFSPQNVYLRWSAVARVWVRAAHFCSAMLTTCFLVEEPCAVQHRGGSRVEQRVQLQVGCCLSRDRNWLCRHNHTGFINVLSTAEGVTIARILDPPPTSSWWASLHYSWLMIVCSCVRVCCARSWPLICQAQQVRVHRL